MKRLLKPASRIGLLIIVAAAAAAGCLWLGKYLEARGISGQPLYYLRTVLYLGLYIFWIVSVRQRILHDQTRRLLISIGVLVIFWLTVRFVKWHFVYDPALRRLLWYLYYLPITLIPSLLALTALSAGRPESWKLPRWSWGLLAIPAALALGVLTNDLHQLAFRFLTPVWNEDDIVHGPVFWFAVGWDLLSACVSLGALIRKCRLPHRRGMLVLPFVPVLLALIYNFAYLLRVPLLMLLFNDFSAALCLLFVGTVECCIICGLIRSNSNYDALFRASSLNAFITDKDYRTVLSSLSRELPTQEQMRQTEDGPVLLESGLRLSGADIQNGHVLWTEDVSELVDVVAQLQDVSERLESRHTVLQREIETTRQRRSRVEKNRLYNRIMTQLETEVRRYADLVEQLSAAAEPETTRRIVTRIAVICTYIKRRANMIFLDESRERDAGGEMEFCLDESMSALRLCGVRCDYNVSTETSVSMNQLSFLYEAMYHTLMQTLDTLSMLYVTAAGTAGRPTLTMRLSCAGVPEAFSGAEIERDGGEWVVTVTAPGDSPETEVAG